MVGDGIVTSGTGFLTRLARSKRAATLPMMAAAVIPMIGMLGGGLDLSRLYIVQTRLQHACDAGALAGRRTMGGGTWAQSSNLPQRTAVQFFDSNIAGRAFGATVGRPTFTESAGRVNGAATATVPMTLMRVFGYQQMALTATCDAEMRLPNSDVMFVLDVTGSMDNPIPGDSEDKIVGLRRAVKCFYEILARLDTDAVCDGAAPTGGTGEDTQIRFGFVPYSANVNVGRLLPSTAFRNSWTYQSRRPATVYGTFSSWDSDTREAGAYSDWVDTGASITVTNSNQCNGTNLPRPADEYIVRTPPTGEDGDSESATNFRAWLRADQRTYQRVYVSSTKICKLQSRIRVLERRAWLNRATATTANAIPVPAWRYEPVEFDLSPLKNGTGWRAGMEIPFGYEGANITVNWDGCVEERQTVRATSYQPIPANAFDLDIDRLPTDDASRWAPALGSISYTRRSSPSGGDLSTSPITTFTNFSRGSFYCPTQSHLLAEWPDADDFDDYVDSLQPIGSTYHDIGLIWGARLMSPTGLFAADNRTTPAGGEIERHMIFMTDGEACTTSTNYQAYGIAWFDRRQTDSSTAPPTGQHCATDSDPGIITNQVNARTTAICEAVRNKNITLWVIWFGESTPTVEAHLRSCATSGRFFSARNSAQLQQTFRDIANQISQLRLTS